MIGLTLSLEATFHTQNSTITSGDFYGTYRHMTSYNTINWDNISFSPAFPYISIEVDFGGIDVYKYDDPLRNSVEMFLPNVITE